MVFFKGRDADAVAQAFKEFVYGNEKRKGRTSVREKLKRFRDAVSQNKNRAGKIIRTGCRAFE